MNQNENNFKYKNLKLISKCRFYCINYTGLAYSDPFLDIQIMLPQTLLAHIKCFFWRDAMFGRYGLDTASHRSSGFQWSASGDGKTSFSDALANAASWKARGGPGEHGNLHAQSAYHGRSHAFGAHVSTCSQGQVSSGAGQTHVGSATSTSWSVGNLKGLITSAVEALLSAQGGAKSGFHSTVSFDPDGAGPAPEVKITLGGGVGVSFNAGGGGDKTPDAGAPAPHEATPPATAPLSPEPAPDTAHAAPVDDCPDEEAPVTGAPVEGTPAAETPVAETPVAETPAPEDCPVEEIPASDTPVMETPVAGTPGPEAPVEEVPQHEVSGGGKGWGDPHFVGADGEKYDVQGEAGKTYNLLSDKGMQVNALFSTYAGNMNVMSKIGVTAGSDQIEIGTNAALKINGETITRDGEYLGGMVSRSWGKVTVKTDEYTVQTSGSAYLDVAFSGKNVQADGVMPAGIWGVTLDGDGKPRLSGGMFGTEGGSMQGGGVLEKADGSITEKGDVETYKEYEVKDIMDLMFPTHNRFAA
jgi:hypothetical protein